MNNQTLINLIKELRESNLVPSKKKTAILANFNDKQIDLLLKLRTAGFVEQYNLNYVIEEISKIKELTFIDQKILNQFWTNSSADDENRVLKFIFNELKINLNIGISNIQKLYNFFEKYYSRHLYIPSIIFDALENKKIRDLKLTGEVLDIYKYISSMPEFSNETFNQINQVILNDDILKCFKNEENNTDKQIAYYNMLKSFVEIIDIDDEKFNQVHNVVSNLAKNKKLEFNMIVDFICDISKLNSEIGFRSLEWILCHIGLENVVIGNLVQVLNNFEEEAEDFEELTNTIKDKVSSEDFNGFYNDLLKVLKSPKIIDNKYTIAEINDFIAQLLDNENFLNYIQENDLDFIICALITQKSHLKEYLAIGTNNSLSIESYSQLLSSFRSNLTLQQLEERVNVYSNQQVLNTIDEDLDILRRLNYVMDHYANFSDGELNLLKNPKFLKSTFFRDKYVEFIKNTNIVQKSMPYQNNFFAILGTFDFDDPNLLFYMTTLFAQTKDAKDLDRIYSERLSNQETGALSDIQTSLYEVLTSKDNEQVEEYIYMLESAPSNFDIKADTQIIYQKQMKKK